MNDFTAAEERRWWEMQLGLKLDGQRKNDAPPEEKPVHRSFVLTRPVDEHGWWELQLGKRLRRSPRD
jgi:hypothetical protein